MFLLTEIYIHQRVISSVLNNSVVSLIMSNLLENVTGSVRSGTINSDGNVTIDHFKHILANLNARFVNQAAHIESDRVTAPQIDTLHLRTETIDSIDANVPLQVAGVAMQENQVGSITQFLDKLYVRTLIADNSLIESASNEVEWTLYETRPSGQPGGNFPANQWMVRKLNREEMDNQDPSNQQLNSQQEQEDTSNSTTILDPDNFRFTLLPGRYDFTWSCPGVRCGSHRSALYNVTLGRFDGFGSNAMSMGFDMTTSTGESSIALVSTTTFELQHFCSNTRHIDGMGVPVGIPHVTEGYARVKIKGYLTQPL